MERKRAFHQALFLFFTGEKIIVFCKSGRIILFFFGTKIKEFTFIAVIQFAGFLALTYPTDIQYHLIPVTVIVVIEMAFHIRACQILNELHSIPPNFFIFLIVRFG
jgi:hypothetical protein